MDLFEAALWTLAICGGCALVWLFGEAVEWFCDAMDEWGESISLHYPDDLA